MADIRVLQKQVGRWALKAWGQDLTKERLLNLLEQEVLDLGVVMSQGQKEGQEEQVAAIMLTLLALADLHGMDLGARASKRFLVNLLKVPEWAIDALDAL